MHLHHMIPKHSSYFNYLGNVKEDSYYKVYLTPEGHIDQHKVLYQVFGDTFDKIACNGLMGENVKPEVFSEAGKRGGRAKPTLEAREKMSEKKKGRKLTDEHKNKIREANKGKKKPKSSEETKEKISKSLIGNSRRKNGKKTWKPDEEYKSKMSEIKKGKKPHQFTEETRKKMSESAKNRKKKTT